MEYLSALLLPQGESDNSDGQKFLSKNAQIEVIVFGKWNIEDDTLESRFNEESRGGLSENPTRVVTYKTLKKGWYVVSGNENGKIFYDKVMLKDGAFKILRIRYDASLDEQLTPIVGRISKSFRHLDSKPL